MKPEVSKRLHIFSSARAEWRGITDRGEASVLVKGTNRRVIVVRSPDPKLFEEAIFVLKEDAKTPQDPGLVLEQASRAAGDYLKKCGVPPVRKRRRGGLLIVTLLSLVLTAAALAAAWYFLL